MSGLPVIGLLVSKSARADLDGRVSKDGRKLGACGDPWRRLRRSLLSLTFQDEVGRILARWYQAGLRNSFALLPHAEGCLGWSGPLWGVPAGPLSLPTLPRAFKTSPQFSKIFVPT